MLGRRVLFVISVIAFSAPLSGRNEPLYPFAHESSITDPVLFGEGVISTPFDEFGLDFTHDGRTLFFSRSVPRSNLYVICTSTFRDGRWSEPRVAPFSGRYWDFDPVVSPDGSRIFFGSDRPVPG